MSTDEDLIKQAIADNPGAVERFARAASAIGWLQHLAVPAAWSQKWQEITEPIGAFMIGKVDHFIEYAQTGEHFTVPDFQPVPYDQRISRARRLRGLLEAWTPPDLPDPIVRAAREVLNAEGMSPPSGWDAVQPSGRQQ
jgi:hypothetical protein